MLDFLKAGLKRSQPLVFDSALLPNVELGVRQKLGRVDESKIQAYHKIVHWQETQSTPLHPCFLHLYAFKQHMQLMLDDRFPFALLGIVHLSNKIDVLTALDLSMDVELESNIVSFERHIKGISFKIESKFYQQQQLIWHSESELLAVDKKSFSGKSHSRPYQLQSGSLLVNQWHCDSAVGRKYGKVSGDFNPIHLSQTSAKLFGFKSAIAHGMWSKARSISEFQEHIGDEFSVAVNFIKPLFLPSDVSLWKSDDDTAVTQFSLTSDDAKVCHLQGQMTF